MNTDSGDGDQSRQGSYDGEVLTQEGDVAPQIDGSPPDEFRYRSNQQRTDTKAHDEQGDRQDGYLIGYAERVFDPGVCG